MYSIQCIVVQGDALSPLLFKFCLENASRKVQEIQVVLILNRIYQLLVYTYIDTIQKNRVNVIDANKEEPAEDSCEYCNEL
jgi:hypothetical protein